MKRFASFSITLSVTALVIGSPFIASRDQAKTLGTPQRRDNVSLAITSETFFNGTCMPPNSSPILLLTQIIGTADNVEVRKEWRSLTDTEKAAYIDAELCLMALDGETGLPGAEGRFDDLQAVHQHWTNTTNGDIIHGVVSFPTSCGLLLRLTGVQGSIPALA